MNTKTHHLLSIPIVKSLACYLRVVHPQPFSYSIKDELGLGIFAVAKINLRRQRRLTASKRRKYKFLDGLAVRNMDHSVVLRLSPGTMLRDGNKAMPDYAIVAVNKYLYEKMMTHLSREINELHGRGMEFRLAIGYVMENYGLCEEDIKFETLKKRNYRYRLAHASSTTRPSPA